MGRPSVDPELLIRMLIVGYCFGIRSERRLCEEVHLNLAYRWFCGLGSYGSAEMLNWLVHERGIEPHIPVLDKSHRSDGTFSRDDFAYDHKRDCYICPAGKQLRQRQKIYRVPRPFADEDGMMRYHASKLDCAVCSLKPRCCPNVPARKIRRSKADGTMLRDPSEKPVPGL